MLYEFFGVLTNLFGGWIGSRVGLRVTLLGGLALQIVALLVLAGVQPAWGPVALGRLRHVGAGAVGHRQGFDEAQLEERRQAVRGGS